MLRARDNPFASARVLRERYRLDDAGWGKLLSRLDALNRRGALVGPHGTGKTTLLEDLEARLRARGCRTTLLRLSTEHPRLPRTCDREFYSKLGAGDFVLLDGAEQLSWLAWWTFEYKTRRAGGLIITTHRAGRLPALHHCRTTPALLNDLAAALDRPIDESTAAALHTRHRGNLREALRELYDRHARAISP
jgi:hypothetical protein